MMTPLLLTGARWPGEVLIEDGRIAAVGEVDRPPGVTVLRCDGAIITPALVNTHHHLWQWLTRGRAVDCDLFAWLSTLYPVWSRMSEADVRAAALVGLSELALGGCTTIFDHHYLVPAEHPGVFEALIEAAELTGVRLYLGRGGMDVGQSAGGLPPDDVVERIDGVVSSIQVLADRIAGHELVEVVAAPNSLFTTSMDLISACAEVAEDLDIRLHTHLAESLDEEAFCLERYGQRPVGLFADRGLLSERLWIGHGIHLSNDEIAKLSAAEVGVAHCPSSNARLAMGLCPVNDLLDAGVAVGLGVDGAASNEIGRLLPDVRQALYLARLRTQRADALLPGQALDLGTKGGARCLGRDDFGRLVPGQLADVVVWPGDDLADVPDPIDGLVLGPDRLATHVLVAGQPIVTDGMLAGVDIDAAHLDLAERSRALWRR